MILNPYSPHKIVVQTVFRVDTMTDLVLGLFCMSYAVSEQSYSL